MRAITQQSVLALAALLLLGCGSMPIEERNQELQLLLGEVQAREQVLDKRQQLLEKRAQLLASLELRQEAAADSVPIEARADAKQMQASFLPAPTEPEQCFRLARLAPRLSAEPQTVVVRDAADQINVKPAVFETQSLELVVDYEPLNAEQQMPAMRERETAIQLRPAHHSWQVMPAQFSEVTESILAAPAHQDFKPCDGDEAAATDLAAHWCVTEVAASYQSLKRQTVSQLSQVQKQQQAAEELKLVIREPVDPANKARLRALKRQFNVQTLVAEASYQREVLLPEFKTVTVRQLTRPAALSWRAVVCQSQKESNLLAAVQAALNARGYEAGEADGAWGQQTADAVARFRKDKMLPDLGQDLSLELLRQLELSAP